LSNLELRFLGDFEVLRDSQPQKLPPSKKTRALLAWLALHPRRFRRDYLCELLWEVPDDPRGSLRWSLSKLRRVVDDEAHKRIVADRNSVGMDAEGVAIDLRALCDLAETGLLEASIETLEQAVDRYRGNFLEGLEFSNFHDFHAWCVAERERAVRARAGLLSELLQRFEDQPERALPHARALVSAAPYDEPSRARLIRLLVELRHADEAEQHYRLGMAMLKEVGAETSGALYSAWRGSPGAAKSIPSAKAISTPDRPAPAPAPRHELLGRESELEALSAIHADVAQRSAACVLMVSGEPGIGKSSLLKALVAMAQDRGTVVLQANAYASEALRPFALWSDALRKADPECADAIFGGQQAGNRDSLLNAIAVRIEDWCDKAPVLLVFDDFHWCDESSAATLHYVIRVNRQHPLMGVVATRAGELADNAQAQQALRDLRHDGLLQELRLGPLPREAIRALIEECAPDADSLTLSGECGGNPLLAINLAHAGKEDAGSLAELVRERLARFDAEQAEVLRWAAVIDPQVDLETLTNLSGLDSERVGQALETAERQALMVGADGGVRFAHNLVGRAVYNGISPLRRQVMHRRVAKMLESRAGLDLDYAAALAHHASYSGDTGLAARSHVSAGKLCLRLFANEQALGHARKGLRLAARLPDAERVCVSLELYEIMLSAAPLEDWESFASECTSLAEQALDLGALEHARLGYQLGSYLRWEHGQWSGAREHSLQAERAVRGGSDEHHIIGLAETGKCLALLERDLPQADAMLMEARALGERLRFSHHAIPMGLGLLRLHEDELDEAEELFFEARTLCKSAGDRISEFQANENLAMIAWYRGDLEQAMERCQVLMDLGAKLREGSEEPMARALSGLCEQERDDRSDNLDQALQDLRVADAKHRLAYTQSRAALMDLERGRAARAVERANEALSCADLLQRPTELLVAHTALAKAYRALGDKERRREHIEAMRALAGRNAGVWAREQAAAELALDAEENT